MSPENSVSYFLLPINIYIFFSFGMGCYVGVSHPLKNVGTPIPVFFVAVRSFSISIVPIAFVCVYLFPVSPENSASLFSFIYYPHFYGGMLCMNSPDEAYIVTLIPFSFFTGVRFLFFVFDFCAFTG